MNSALKLKPRTKRSPAKRGATKRSTAKRSTARHATRPATRHATTRRPAAPPLKPPPPLKSVDALLDEALSDTFPASDPVALIEPTTGRSARR